jgi:dihydroorotase
MNRSSRREVLKAGAFLGGSALFGAGAAFAQLGVGGPNRYDLVIRGGEVLDPSQGLRGKRDVAIKNAKIAAIEREIPAEMGAQTLDAAGRLVVPGLVDLHAHVYPQGSAIGLPADELVPFTSTTTYVSAGDAGGNNFSAFKHYVIGQARSRIYAFVHISAIGLAGFPVGEMKEIEYANVDLAAKTMAENPDVVLGVKVRETIEVVGTNGIEPLRRARLAAERAGTHSYSGAGNNTVQDGKVIAAALEAKKRGVLIDVGHGGGSFSYAVAEPAIQQGLVPDTISSDIHAYSGNSPGMPFLPWVMSKFLNMGFSLEQVISLATEKPAKIIGKVDKLGTLQVGAPGDVAILELVEGAVEFVDTVKNTRKGTRYLKPVQTIRAGRPYGRPFPAPFSYP